MLLLDELRDAWRAEPRDHRIALVAIVVAAVVLRLLYLSQPMRYDESVTWLEFARYPLAQALSRYTYPNNHLFHTLLAKASIAVFGDEPWALRLPAFVAGVATVPASYVVAREMYGARAALLTAALVATSGALILYSTNARGYSIVGLAFLVLLLLAVRLMRRPTLALWAAFALVAAIGCWTIPTMLYPLGAVCLWIALTFVVEGRHKDWPWFAAALTLGAALTLAAYAPVIMNAGVASVVRNRFVASSAWPQFFADLADTWWEALQSWGLGLPPMLSLVALFLAVRALSRHAELSRSRVGLPLAVFVWCAWLLVASHRAPFARVWLWLLPVAASLVGAGLVATLESWARTKLFVQHRTPLLALLLTAGTALSVLWSGSVRFTTDTGTFVDAEEAAATLARILRPGDRIVAPIPSNAPLAYYWSRRGLDSTALTLSESSAERLLVIVNQGEGQTLDRILRGSPARDTALFAGKLIAEMPSSTIVVFERKHGQSR